MHSMPVHTPAAHRALAYGDYVRSAPHASRHTGALLVPSTMSTSGMHKVQGTNRFAKHKMIAGPGRLRLGAAATTGPARHTCWT
jgi:hypothetical protein